jgi:Rab-GTPase-TBC domain
MSSGKELEVVNSVISLCVDNRFLALGVYDETFPVVQFLKKMFWNVLFKLDKKLAKSIKDSGLPDDVWLTKWFISFFTGYFSPFYAARFLDFVFNQDVFVMPVLAAVVTVSLKNKIMG